MSFMSFSAVPYTTRNVPEPPMTDPTPPKNDIFAEVVLPIPLDRTFSYAVPASLRDRVVVG